jgi:hypothetical protein
MGIMAQDDTAATGSRGTALVVSGRASSLKPSLARSSSNADFLSQMIAERQHLAPQRARRQAALGSALSAYAEGGVRGVPRLPAGFFRSRSV